MTPTYPGVYVGLGLVFLLQSPSRTSGPAFAAAKLVAPIALWGAVFLVVGLLEASALALMQARRPPLAERARNIYVRCLQLGAGLAGFWTVLLFAAAAQSPLVSYSSGIWPLLGTIAHIASARSLAWREGHQL